MPSGNRGRRAAPRPAARSADGAPRAAVDPLNLPAVATLAVDGLAYALVHAADLVAAVTGGHNLTDRFEQQLQRHPDWPDGTRGAVRDLAWGTLRDYGRGDAVLDRLMSKPLTSALVHALLLVALHRLEARPAQAHTVVDQAVEAAAVLAPGLKGVVNGVLRNALRQADALARLLDADETARYRHPDWWIARLRTSYPDRWADALAGGNSHPPMSLRVNPRRATVDAVAQELAEAGVGCRRLDNDALVLDRPVPVGRLPGFAEGRVSVQDAGAQWAARWLAPADGERVLDACSAPGGKAAHLLETAAIDLLALEIDPSRAERIRRNLDRLGLDGTIRVGDVRDVDAWWDGRPFDRILADVPCSASGVARRHPDIKWLRRREDIAGFAAQQAEILDALWQTLAPDGTMLYVTCSVFDEENRGQIARFCARHADALRLPIDGRLEQQLLPNTDHDGFYYALLRKRS